MKKDTLKKDTLKMIEDNKIIAILRNVDKNKLIKLADSLYDGGIRLMEVAFNQSDVNGDNNAYQMIKELNDHFKNKVTIGAGTVLTLKELRLAYKAGAKFIVSPNANKKIISFTNGLGLVSIPGALTPNEIYNAHLYGADIVKIFPAGDMGIKYIKSIMAPLSNIKLMLNGGITKDEVKDYLSLGVIGIGVQSNIISKEMLDNNDFESITNLAKEYIKGASL